MDITIKADDGKLFHGTDFKELEAKVNKYEYESELQRLALEDMRKEAEEDRKAKEESEKVDWNKVIEAAKYFNKVAGEYSDKHKTGIGYTLNASELIPRRFVGRSLFSEWFMGR